MDRIIQGPSFGVGKFEDLGPNLLVGGLHFNGIRWSEVGVAVETGCGKGGKFPLIEFQCGEVAGFAQSVGCGLQSEEVPQLGRAYLGRNVPTGDIIDEASCKLRLSTRASFLGRCRVVSSCCFWESLNFHGIHTNSFFWI